VQEKEGSLDNYVGSDRHGWGFLANRAIWHDKAKLCSFGELFKQGDCISVRLDMDLGTLSFHQNDRDLGIAVEGLKGGKAQGVSNSTYSWLILDFILSADLYPAVSLYNENDQLSFIPTEPNSSTLYSVIGGTSMAEGVVQQMSYLHAIMSSLASSNVRWVKSNDTIISTQANLAEEPSQLVSHVWKRWQYWQRHACVIIIDSDGRAVELNTSPDAFQKFGVSLGDRVHTVGGPATAAGVGSGACRHMLCLKLVNSEQYIFCSMKTVREALLSKPQISATNISGPVGSGEAKEDTDIEKSGLQADHVPLNVFGQWMDNWTPQMDAELCDWLNGMTDSSKPTFELAYSNVLSPPEPVAPLIYNKHMPLSSLRARVAWLLHLNISFLSVLQHTQLNTPHSLITANRFRILAFTKKLLLRRLVNRTKLACKERSSICLTIKAMRKAATDRGSIADARNLTSVFGHEECIFLQVVKQIRNWPPCKLRQHQVTNGAASTAGKQEQIFDVILNGLENVDQQAAYQALFHLLAGAITANTGMFCPLGLRNETLDCSTSYIPSSCPARIAVDEKQADMFKAVGQLMGVAVRTEVGFPINLAEEVWQALVGGTLEGEGMTTETDDDDCALRSLMNLKTFGVTDDNIPELFPYGLPLLAPLRNGSVTKLDPHKATIPASLANAEVWALQSLAVRRNEYHWQVAAMYSGFTSVIPACVVNLMTWRELRQLVHGCPLPLLEILKHRARYTGDCSESHPSITVCNSYKCCYTFMHFRLSALAMITVFLASRVFQTATGRSATTASPFGSPSL